MLQNRTKVDADPGSINEYAARAISEYSLNQAGITYALQGYLTSEGYLPAWKIEEHMLIDRFMTEAIHDRNKKRSRKHGKDS